jgi:tripartite-type tricarboxylate transporter receptor subunit TctC
MVPANSPYKSVKDLVDAARSSPDTWFARPPRFRERGRLVIFLLAKAVRARNSGSCNFKASAKR